MLDVFGEMCGRQCSWSERTQRITITVILFGISLVLALVVPNIGAVISLLGGSAALFIFFFPGKFLSSLPLCDESIFLPLDRLLFCYTMKWIAFNRPEIGFIYGEQIPFNPRIFGLHIFILSVFWYFDPGFHRRYINKMNAMKLTTHSKSDVKWK